MNIRAMKLALLKRVLCPPEVCSGRDSLERLSCLDPDARVLLVVSPSVGQPASLDKITSKLKDSAAVEVLHWNSGEPAVSSVSAVGDAVAAFAPNWIVAVGGGAVLDAAKFLWAAYEHPEVDWSGPAKPVPPLRTKARLALVPTTAGSGSEASRAAVLINSAGAKTAYVSQDWLPDIVVLDPALTLSLPAKETMSTGFDALTHAIEAGVSSISNPMVRSLAASAVRGILANLMDAIRDPRNLAAREALQNAAYLAGLAQSTASTGAAHGFSHATAAVFHSAHGLTTGFYLPHTMQWNYRQNATLYDALAAECGMTNGSGLIAAVCGLANQAGLPAHFEVLVGRSLTSEEITLIAGAATKDVCMKTNPCRMNAKEAEPFLRDIG